MSFKLLDGLCNAVDQPQIPLVKYVGRKEFEVKKQVKIIDSPTNAVSSTTNLNKPSRLRPECSFKVDTYCVNFKKVLADETSTDIVEGTDNMSLLHATAGLYSLSLPDVEHDTIYKCLNSEDATTILVMLTMSDAKDHCYTSVKAQTEKMEQEEAQYNEDSKNHGDDGDDEYMDEEESFEEEEDEEELLEEEMDKFNGLYSDFDCSSAEEEEEESEDEESTMRYMNTMDDFLSKVWKRKETVMELYKKNKHNNVSASDIPDHLVGMERRLIGCVTVERCNEVLPERVLVVTLLATRRKYKGLGVGSHMFRVLRNPLLCGYTDVMIVNADDGAVGFFEKQGFTKDVLLNSPYQKLHNQWFNTHRMIRFSNYGGEHHLDRDRTPVTHTSKPMSSFELQEMEAEIRVWTERSVEAHQKLSLNMMRMRKEVFFLNELVDARDKEIVRLRNKLQEVDSGKQQAITAPVEIHAADPQASSSMDQETINKIVAASVQEFLSKQSRPGSPVSTSVKCATEIGGSSSDQLDGCFKTFLEQLSKIRVDLDKQKRSINERERNLIEKLNHKSTTTTGSDGSLKIKKLLVPSGGAAVDRFRETATVDEEEESCRDLYFCGCKIAHDDDVLGAGRFTEKHFTKSELGSGLHFARDAHTAAELTQQSELLLCKVLPGRCRRHNDPEHAIVDVISFLSDYDSVASVDGSKLVVFNPTQVLPHSIVHFKKD